MNFFRILMLFFLIILTSCSIKQKIDNQNINIKNIVLDSSTVLIDVRVKEQYNQGTTKGAIHISLAELEQNLDFFKDKKTVVFCNSGKQADQAIELLKKNHIQNAYDGTS